MIMESSLLKAAIQQEIQQMMDRVLDNAIAKNPFIAAINACSIDLRVSQFC